MGWMQEYDAVFFISVLTLAAGVIKYSFDKCFQSKCEEFGICWNFLTVKRRVDLEVQQSIREMELHTSDLETNEKSETKKEVFKVESPKLSKTDSIQRV
jgi:hypothetical protein